MENIFSLGLKSAFTDDFKVTGQAVLYGNPVTSIIDGNAFCKYGIHLTDWIIIAKGFTAFAKGCYLVGGTLWDKIKIDERPNTHELFTLYLKTALDPERNKNNTGFKPKTGLSFEIELYQHHIEAEKEKLNLSQSFYDLYKDIAIAEEVRKYAEYYIEWLQDKLNEITQQPKIKNAKLNTPAEENYSQRQIVIAYLFVKGFRIDSSNAADLLKKHSQAKSVSKLLQKRIASTNDLVLLSGNRTADTKHLKDLKAAERLLLGIKNDEAVKSLTNILTAFETTYNTEY